MAFCTIIALIMRVGEGASATERAAGMVLHDKAHADSSTHPNSPYGTRSRVASSSTPNLSTLQRFMSPTTKAAKPSAYRDLVYLQLDPTATTTTTGGEWTSAMEARGLRLVDLGRLQR